MVEEYKLPERVFRVEGKVNAAAGKSGVKARGESYADKITTRTFYDSWRQVLFETTGVARW